MRDEYIRNQYLSYHRTYVSNGTTYIDRDYTGRHRKASGHRGDLIPSDGILPTPYQATKYECTANSFKLVKEVYLGTDTYEGQLWLPAKGLGSLDGKPWDVRFPNRISNRAKANCMDNLRNNNVDVGQFLGELPETISFIVGQAITVARAYRAVRKGNYAGAGQILKTSIPRNPKDAASAWLGLKFGWQPLLQDIYDASQFQSLKPGFASARGVATENHVMTSLGSGYSWKGDPKHLKGAECKVFYTVEDAWLANLTSLGLTNPLSIAWELVPLSFVIDWLMPIGSTIRALNQDIGLNFHHGYVTEFSKGSFEFQMDNFVDGEGDQPSWRVSTSGMNRVPLYSFPLQKLAIPSFLNANQGLTLLALLTQRT